MKLDFKAKEATHIFVILYSNLYVDFNFSYLYFHVNIIISMSLTGLVLFILQFITDKVV